MAEKIPDAIALLKATTANGNLFEVRNASGSERKRKIAEQIFNDSRSIRRSRGSSTRLARQDRDDLLDESYST